MSSFPLYRLSLIQSPHMTLEWGKSPQNSWGKGEWVNDCLQKAPEKLNQAIEQNVRQDPFPLIT